MKIAVPSETNEGLQSTRSGHFGHAPYFTIVDIENGTITNVESIKNVEHDAVGCGGVIDFVISLEVDGILAAGMGQPPFMRFSNAGIDVYFDQTCQTADEAVDLLIEGKIEPMRFDQTCTHH